MTKLSLVTILTISAAVAGGDIAPVEPVVEAPAVVESSTSISGKASLIYITNDNEIASDMFSKGASESAAAITLDVSHKIIDNIVANFTAIGYTSLGNTIGNGTDTWTGNYLEGQETGAYFNVANITATYADTTLIAGRQLLGTPMLQGYDWLIAPGAFEAYTLANQSIGNLTLVASYIDKWRANNSGETFAELNGDNWTVGATYSEGFDVNIWYYNIDAANYTQVYADVGYTFSGIALEAQYVSTSFDTGFGTDSSAFGARISTTIAGFDLSAAYNRLIDGTTGYIGWNNLYVNSWNMSVADQYNGQDLDAFKVSASTTIAGISATISYADFDNGHETDVILGYDITQAIDFTAVYTNNKNNTGAIDSTNVLEFYANYKF
ncbi:MAG TPA: hypothetical protein EYH42_06990 [Sulfurovum sp.]|nr:hypothetical protein [Sulfurovum sp.]